VAWQRQRKVELDSLTQLALGAVTGYAVAGHRLGRKALVYGAIAGTTPDLDSFVLAPFETDEWSGWLNHRGVSHSLFFGPIVGPALGWLAWRYYRQKPGDPAGAPDMLRHWIAVFVVGLFTHPLLDLCTIYGTQLLAPFSDTRFAISSVGIIDPIYTVPMLAAMIAALVRPRAAGSRITTWIVLWLTTAFLFYGLSQNQRVEAMSRAQLADEGVSAADVRVYTTIFQPWLRRVVVDDPEGGRVAFASSLQTGAIAWQCFTVPRDPRIEAARLTREGRLLTWFANGDVWPDILPLPDGGTRVMLWDRRYGVPGPTINGWWGVEVGFESNGQRNGTPQRIALPREVTGDALAQFWRASLGAPTALFPHAPGASAAAEECRRQRRTL
jgi:inner membrane protein